MLLRYTFYCKKINDLGQNIAENCIKISSRVLREKYRGTLLGFMDTYFVDLYDRSLVDYQWEDFVFFC